MTWDENVLAIARMAGLEPRQRGEEWAIRCPGPAHQHDERRSSLRLNERENAWQSDGGQEARR